MLNYYEKKDTFAPRINVQTFLIKELNTKIIF